AAARPTRGRRRERGQGYGCGGASRKCVVCDEVRRVVDETRQSGTLRAGVVANEDVDRLARRTSLDGEFHGLVSFEGGYVEHACGAARRAGDLDRVQVAITDAEASGKRAGKTSLIQRGAGACGVVEREISGSAVGERIAGQRDGVGRVCD